MRRRRKPWGWDPVYYTNQDGGVYLIGRTRFYPRSPRGRIAGPGALSVPERAKWYFRFYRLIRFRLGRESHKLFYPGKYNRWD